MRTLAIVTLIAAFSVQSTSHAEVEKFATICKAAICPHWWPKIDPPVGWKHDRDHSFHFNFNALAPAGKSFGEAETVMYANAVYKPRVPEASTLDAFISGDHKSFRERAPDLVIRASQPLKTKDGKVAATWLLEPRTEGQWERVAYFEETDYFMVFVVTSRTEDGLRQAMPSFEQLVQSYKE